MRVAVIGGLQKLARDYEREVARHGHECAQYNSCTHSMRCRLPGADAVILFTSMVSHEAANAARCAARGSGIPLLCPKGSGVSSLRRCLETLAAGGTAAR
jgi:hypothetical protein